MIVSVNDEPTDRLSELTAGLEAPGIGENTQLAIRRDRRLREITLQIVDIGAFGPDQP